ncbi:LacI family DNA-binding transcriptional regulator [Furfurilactobacillus curtus]|uniref:LacI family transcriptional regulator n=1 Tax=Furfurilactobacillus curtus TaxID=1746200 RepID=A0ABQ5JPJ6_9LACO
MAKKITITDIATAANISPTTVSQILNGKGERFSAATRQKVFALQKELGYYNTGNDKSFESKVTVGMIVPSIDNPYYRELIHGVQSELAKRYAELSVEFSNESEKIAYHIHELTERPVDAIIVVGDNVDLAFVQTLLANTGLANVVMDRQQDNESPVAVNELDAGSKAAEYLLDNGHRQIALLMKAGNSESKLHRITGFSNGLKEYHLDLDPRLFIEQPDDSKVDGFNAAKQVIDSGVTAVFAFSDELAIGLNRGLLAHGKRVPEDISILGFDDIEITRYVQPELSTVHQPIQEMGAHLVDRLFTKDSSGKLTKKLFEVVLKKRGSIKHI